MDRAIKVGVVLSSDGGCSSFHTIPNIHPSGEGQNLKATELSALVSSTPGVLSSCLGATVVWVKHRVIQREKLCQQPGITCHFIRATY